VLVLTVVERDALIRALRAVEDNWWLSPPEQDVLVRLEADRLNDVKAPLRWSTRPPDPAQW
jgi:hypothetical protein